MLVILVVLEISLRIRSVRAILLGLS